jgi:hypothetical protein
LSGEPDQLRSYLTRNRRDRRFDRTITAALRDGKPIPIEIVNRIVCRYADRLLELRGEMLADTETMTALGKSRDDAIRQQIAAGKIVVEDVTKVWRSAGDSRVRYTHRVLNGKSAPMDGFFASPSGATLRFPGDPQAPGSEIVGCRCWMDTRSTISPASFAGRMLNSAPCCCHWNFTRYSDAREHDSCNWWC